MKKDLAQDLAWGIGIIVLALIATLARQQGVIDADAATRIIMGSIGLMLAWFGNRMPKQFVPDRNAKQAARIGGWSMALSGIVYACLWVFAPFQVAVVGGCAAVLIGIAVTFAYCLALRSKTRTAR